MINRNLQNKPSIIYGDGEQQRCFSYVDDCVYCLEAMTLDPNIKSQIINIGPDEDTITINELSTLIANECGYNGGPVYVADRPCEVKIATCSSDLARKLLNYQTKTDVKTAIKHTANYIRQKGPKEFSYSFPLEIVNELTPKTWKDKLI